jgi:hypothetical protein
MPLLKEVRIDGRRYKTWAVREHTGEFDRNKAPIFEDVMPAPETVAAWYGTRTGLGAVMGAVSGNLELFEFDDYETYSAFKSLGHATGLGPLIERVERGYSERTPNGGVHWFLRCDAIGTSAKLAKRPQPTDKDPHATKTLIETKENGGYAVMAPSYGAVHPTGRSYEVLQGSVSSIVELCAEERESLHELGRSFDEMPAKNPRTKASATKVENDGDRPGDIYNMRATWQETLGPHGWRHIYDVGDTEYWRRPGKSTSISASINRNGTDRLIVFSTSTPFDQTSPSSYSKFEAYAVLNHDGDWSAAGMALYEQGFHEEYQRYTHASHAKDIAPGHGDNAAQTPSAPDWPEPPGEAAFSGLAGRVVNLIDPYSEADRAAVLIQFLVAFGNCVGHKPHFMVGATRHSAVEYLMVVGPSARGGKGDSWQPVKYLLCRAAPEWAITSGLSTGEGFIWLVRDPIKKKEPIKSKGRITDYQDVITDHGVADKRVLIQEPEIGRTLTVAGRQGNTLSAVARDNWDGSNLSISTKVDAAKATGAHASIIGHITAEELTDELTDLQTVNGFANRFLFAAARRSKRLPEPEPFEGPEIEAVIKRIATTIDFIKTTGRMERDEGARALWDEVYDGLVNGREGICGKILERARAHVLRLSMIYALLDCSSVIRVDHLQAAIEVWGYTERTVVMIYGDLTGNPLADTILRALRSHNGLDRTAISSLFGRHVLVDRIDKALQLLLINKKAGFKPITTGGRPSEMWYATA